LRLIVIKLLSKEDAAINSFISASLCWQEGSFAFINNQYNKVSIDA
jgi:hypothetical protein